MKAEGRNLFIRFFKPQYNEAGLFLMSSSFILLFFSNQELRDDLAPFFKDFIENFITAPLAGLTLLATLALGLWFSIYHVFTDRPKTKAEMSAMLCFGIFVNFISGFAGGAYMFDDFQGVLVVFPVWNIINSLTLLISYAIFKENCVVNDNASPAEVIIGLTVVVACYAVCNLVLKLHWAYTYSICVTYACNVDRLVQKIFQPSAVSSQ